MAKYTRTTWDAGRLITKTDMDNIERQFELITPGATNIAGDWDDNKQYKKGDYCFYDGDLWICLSPCTAIIPQENAPYWKQILVTQQFVNIYSILDTQDTTIKDFHSNVFEYSWVETTEYDQLIVGSGNVDNTQSGIRGVKISSDNRYQSIIVYLHKGDKICAPEFEEDDNSYYAITVGENYSGVWTSDTAPTSISSATARRFRKTTNENDLPTATNPYIAQAETVVIITVPMEQTAKYRIPVETDTLASSILLHTNQINQVLNSQIKIDTDLTIYYASAKYIYVYVPTLVINYYLKYTIEHYTNNNTDADMWLIRKCDLTLGKDINNTVIFPVVIEGQWEIALKMQSDTVDHIGGKNHGSEVMLENNLWFFLNGKLFTPIVGQTYTGKEFSFMINSEMHYPSDASTTVALHHNKTTFSLSMIEMEQSIEWKVDDQVQNSYICMLPLCRGNDANTSQQVTDYGYDYLTLTPYDISQPDFTHYMKNSIIGRKKITEYGVNSGIEATAAIEGNFIDGQYGFIQNTGDKPTNSYNKIYLTYAPNNTAVQNNDIWTWKNKYIIKYSV